MRCRGRPRTQGSRLFPRRDRLQRHYKRTGTSISDKEFKSEDTIILKIIQIEEAADGRRVRFTTDPDESDDILLVGSKGVFRTHVGQSPINPPIRLLQAPLKVGDSWKYNYEIDALIVGKVRADESVTVAREKVRVPAGEYDAIRVNRKIASAPLLRKNETEITTWYAPKVGRIKERIVEDKDIVVVLELEKYDAEK